MNRNEATSDVPASQPYNTLPSQGWHWPSVLEFPERGVCVYSFSMFLWVPMCCMSVCGRARESVHVCLHVSVSQRQRESVFVYNNVCVCQAGCADTHSGIDLLHSQREEARSGAGCISCT